MKLRAVWKRGQNKGREYPKRLIKLAVCLSIGIHLFSGQFQEFIGECNVCLTIAIPAPLRLLNLTESSQLLCKSVIWSQVQRACFFISLKDIYSRQGSIRVVCGDTVPHCEKDDRDKNYENNPRKNGLHLRPLPVDVLFMILAPSAIRLIGYRSVSFRHC